MRYEVLVLIILAIVLLTGLALVVDRVRRAIRELRSPIVIYMLKVNMLVEAIVSGFARLLILALVACTAARDYARALRTMQRISGASRAFRDFAMNSRDQIPNSFRAA